MRIVALAFLFAVGAFPDQSPGPSVVFLFGSCGAVHARDAARSAAGVCRRWLKQPGATAEIRKSGAAGGIPLYAGTPAKNIESVLEIAAKESRDADANSFLSSLD